MRSGRKANKKLTRINTITDGLVELLSIFPERFSHESGFPVCRVVLHLEFVCRHCAEDGKP